MPAAADLGVEAVAPAEQSPEDGHPPLLCGAPQAADHHEREHDRGRAQAPSSDRPPGARRSRRALASVERKSARRRRPRARRRAPSGAPRRASRAPSSALAPRITGSAACQERACASRRANPRARAAVSVAPLRETPGISASGLGEAERQPVARAGVLAGGESPRRAGVGERHRDGARDQTRGDRARPAEAALDRPPQRVARRSRAARASRRSRRPAPVQASSASSQQLAAHVDRQRDAGARVQRDLEGLAQLRVELGVAPAGEPRDQRRVGRGGDRQQLGRALQQAEGDRVACERVESGARLNTARCFSRRPARVASVGSARRLRRMTA